MIRIVSNFIYVFDTSRVHSDGFDGSPQWGMDWSNKLTSKVDHLPFFHQVSSASNSLSNSLTPAFAYQNAYKRNDAYENTKTKIRFSDVPHVITNEYNYQKNLPNEKQVGIQTGWIQAE